jgi:prophage antirepressor-like protein
MNELMTLTFQGSNIRMVMRDGEPWWVARDVCEALEIQNVTQAMGRLDDDERAMFNIGPQGETNIVNEPGLYGLVLGSRKPEAREFKRWVTHDVLPSIRRTGSYSVEGRYGPQTMVGQFAIPTTYSGAMRLAADLQEKVEEQKATIQLMAPKAEFHDRVTDSRDAQSIREVAKILGTGQNRMFAWLRGQRILMSDNTPYQEYVNAGYFRLIQQTWTDRAGEDHLTTKTLVTGKGLTWIQRRWDQDNGHSPLRVV